ncbi:protein Aatf [Drosophila novamexicana]|uniref:protein Aatf n=1 Tax=Drosophila novamexicana TaxID=47314 RepID=UPI0011E5EE9C|nr:protein Aatf [Drosophila novamexicana]
MLRKSKKQAQTVAEKVSKLLAHPNDSDSDNDSDIDVTTKARVVDFEDEYDLPDVRSTDFRKRNVKLLSEQSERYKGRISSRKEFEQEEEDEEQEESEDEDGAELAYEESDSEQEATLTLQATNGKQSDEDDDSSMEDYENEGQQEEDDDEDDEEDDDDDDDDDDEENDSEDADSGEDVNEIMPKTNQQAEVQKGLCVQNQLRIWERLLELRINTQKVTSKANQLPSPETLKELSENNEELKLVLSEAQERSAKLLEQLLALQAALTEQHSELRQSVKRKQPADASTEPTASSKRHANALQNNFENMRSYRNEVLLKWDDRTKLLTPGAGVKRKTLQEDYDIIKKIDSALANREALVEKSQILKNNQQQPQPNAVEDADATANGQRQRHIYDDSDFYHQQLRELIEYKASSTSSMSDIAKQFVELQKLRQKMKRKVDTRASKGRKLRYVVHNKLINFMAPNEASDWTDDSKAELFRSLFV